MKNTNLTRAAASLLACGMVFGLTACSSSASSSEATAESAASSEAASESTVPDDATAESAADDYSYLADFSFSDAYDENGYLKGITALDYVTLPDTENFTLSDDATTVSDSDIDNYISNNILSNYKTTNEITNRAAENGDTVNIDFAGSIDGVAFDGGTGSDYDLTLGSGTFIDGFEDQIVGHSAGEEFDVNVTFPEEYQAAELAGKAAVFKIKLHEVKYKELPALDDELAKDCSEYDTLEEFKESIRKNNQEQLDKQDDLAVENALVDQVIESMEAEIPQAMYDTRMDEMVNDFAFRVEQQGLRLEDYLKYMGQTMDQFRASFMPQAEKQVKIRLALEAVAAAENIEASEEDVSAEIKRIADQYKMEEDKVRELVNVDDLKKDLAINKAIDFIKSHANIVEKAAEAEKTEDAE